MKMKVRAHPHTKFPTNRETVSGKTPIETGQVKQQKNDVMKNAGMSVDDAQDHEIVIIVAESGADPESEVDEIEIVLETETTLKKIGRNETERGTETETETVDIGVGRSETGAGARTG